MNPLTREWVSKAESDLSAAEKYLKGFLQEKDTSFG